MRVALIAVTVLAAFLAAPAARAADPIPVRVVVVTMYEESGPGDPPPGELRGWVERYPLPETIPFPAGERDLRYNRDRAVLAILTGVGTARAAASITALGLDPRFDLSRAYWLVAGIAGADPDVAPLGSAVWADWVVDGDLAFEIDAREIPSGWPTGYVPLAASRPYQEPVPPHAYGPAYRLDAGLVAWAYGLTREVSLPDNAALAAWRAKFAGHPAALLPPRVQKGDVLSASTFWHGQLLTGWARRWVPYWTGGEGVFAASAMEDTGTLAALTRLDKAGRADLGRVLVLRTTSNFSMQHDGISAAQSLAGEADSYTASGLALDAAVTVGRVVVDALVADWDTYSIRPPGAP